VFTFVPAAVAPDDKLRVIAADDPFVLGVLSSRIHVVWAEAAGGRLGVGNDPVYNQTLCFNPFPFPDPAAPLRTEIAEIAERIDAHRAQALQRDRAVTLTGMYNVIAKLATGASLTEAERRVHEHAACDLLRDLHASLDVKVAHAYLWEWPLTDEEILALVVALHDERKEEEEAGRVRWLRPEFQAPRFGTGVQGLELRDAVRAPVAEQVTNGRPPWPRTAAEQIGAIQEVLAVQPLTSEAAAARFHGARHDIVIRHLETLVLIGEARKGDDGRYHVVSEPAPAPLPRVS
jgi:hypothetical protein